MSSQEMRKIITLLEHAQGSFYMANKFEKIQELNNALNQIKNKMDDRTIAEAGPFFAIHDELMNEVRKTNRLATELGNNPPDKLLIENLEIAENAIREHITYAAVLLEESEGNDLKEGIGTMIAVGASMVLLSTIAAGALLIISAVAAMLSAGLAGLATVVIYLTKNIYTMIKNNETVNNYARKLSKGIKSIGQSAPPEYSA